MLGTWCGVMKSLNLHLGYRIRAFMADDLSILGKVASGRWQIATNNGMDYMLFHTKITVGEQ